MEIFHHLFLGFSEVFRIETLFPVSLESLSGR